MGAKKVLEHSTCICMERGEGIYMLFQFKGEFWFKKGWWEEGEGGRGKGEGGGGVVSICRGGSGNDD